MFYKWQNNDLLLSVRIQPNASQDAFSKVVTDPDSLHTDEYIKIQIKAAPVDGKANTHMVAFLAKTFKVAKSNIIIISGQTRKNKRLLIKNPQLLPACIKGTQKMGAVD